MNKRVLRKFAIPSNSPNPKNGIFCADQVKYVVRTAIKTISARWYCISTQRKVCWPEIIPLAGQCFSRKAAISPYAPMIKAHAGSSLCLRTSERITFSGTNALSIPRPTRDGSRDIVSPKSKKDLKASACFSWICCGKSNGKMN